MDERRAGEGDQRTSPVWNKIYMSLGLAARRGAGDLGHFWTRSTLPEALRSEASRLTLSSSMEKLGDRQSMYGRGIGELFLC